MKMRLLITLTTSTSMIGSSLTMDVPRLDLADPKAKSLGNPEDPEVGRNREVVPND